MGKVDLDEILALERAVWAALVAGDAAADARLLADGFLGVYETGFSDKAGHVAPLACGPTVAAYRLEQARLLPLGADHVLLAYLARYRRVGREAEEGMYVSSIWARGPGGWRNLFSQDTAEGDRQPV